MTGNRLVYCHMNINPSLRA